MIEKDYIFIMLDFLWYKKIDEIRLFFGWYGCNFFCKVEYDCGLYQENWEFII